MNLTQEELKKILSYDPGTGVFTWIVKRRPRTKVGDRAGFAHSSVTSDPYIKIKAKGQQYQAHRLIWLYVHGEFPEDEIDHIDGNGLNNKLSNLRNVSRIINGRNLRLSKNNKSGISGVRYSLAQRRWIFSIGGGKCREFGSFDNLLEACCARKSAEKRLGYHSNHGRLA